MYLSDVADVGVGYQGSRPQDKKIICICQTWPMWVSAIRAQGYEPLSVYVPFIKKYRRCFQGMRPSVWRSIHRLQLNLIPKKYTILISGNFDFLVGLNLQDYRGSIGILIEGAQPHRRRLPKELRWERIKHNQCGGVTDGNFWFGVSANLRLLPGGLYSTRFLVNVISPAAKVQQKDHPPPLSLLTTSKVILIGDTICALGLLPIQHVSADIIVPSVFSKSKWCKRKLTSKEIADIYDQPYSVTEECLMKKIRPVDLPFVSAIPNKVVQCAVRKLGLTHHLPRDKLGSPIRLPQLFPPIIQDADDLKAVKSDDFKVKTYIWDERVVKHFAHLGCDERTVRSLNCIRKITTRWWAKCVWKSFLGIW